MKFRIKEQFQKLSTGQQTSTLNSPFTPFFPMQESPQDCLPDRVRHNTRVTTQNGSCGRLAAQKRHLRLNTPTPHGAGQLSSGNPVAGIPRPTVTGCARLRQPRVVLNGAQVTQSQRYTKEDSSRNDSPDYDNLKLSQAERGGLAQH